MENDILLSPIRMSDLVASLREIIKEELRAAQGAQEQDKLMSPADACKIFTPKISRGTLSNWTNDGLIPVQRIGGRLWYKHSDLLTAGSTLKRYKPTRT